MTIPDMVLREMIGDALADALATARTRLADDTVIVRCEAGLWLVERAETVVASGLAHDDVAPALLALS